MMAMDLWLTNQASQEMGYQSHLGYSQDDGSYTYSSEFLKRFPCIYKVIQKVELDPNLRKFKTDNLSDH